MLELWGLLLGGAGVLATGIGIIVTLIIRQRKLLTWIPGEVYAVADLLDNPDDGLELRHRGRPLTAAAMATVTLRNGGNLAIRADDFDPDVTISVDEEGTGDPYPVLSARVLGGADPLDEVVLKVQDKKVVVPAVTWNRGDWMEVQVVYEGTTDAEVNVRGRVLDAPPLRRVVPSERMSAAFRALGWALGLGSLGVAIVAEEDSVLGQRAFYMFLGVLLVFWFLPSAWDSNPVRLVRGLPTKPADDDE